MNKFFGHLRTVNQHRRMVRKLCFKCGLYNQGLLHDLSKYSPVEFINGVKFYTGTGSPHIGERQAYGYSKAWLNHKGKNKHHAEYWQDICSDGFTHPIPMPEKYFFEMLCDRIAASMIYLGDKFTAASPLEYYETHRDENQFHGNTRWKLETWLRSIERDGVDVTLKRIKERLKYQ
jgi:hypothetical protein